MDASPLGKPASKLPSGASILGFFGGSGRAEASTFFVSTFALYQKQKSATIDSALLALGSTKNYKLKNNVLICKVIVGDF